MCINVWRSPTFGVLLTTVDKTRRTIAPIEASGIAYLEKCSEPILFSLADLVKCNDAGRLFTGALFCLGVYLLDLCELQRR